jgi:hypothetical protein
LVYARRTLLLLAAFLLVWRISASGISAHYLGLVKDGDEAGAVNALAWKDRQPAAAYRQGLALLESDPEAAERMLEAAFRENPADPQPLLALADIAEERGERERADALVEAAVVMYPAASTVHEQVAGYWALRGQPERAMRHWSLVLAAEPAERVRLFPLLLEIAEDPESRGAFSSLLRDPPEWWERFFAFAALRASDPDTVRALYAMRRSEGESPLSERERKDYIERLRKDGEITEAYLVWINGLSDSEQEQLGLLYNGNFEIEPSGLGFDWHLIGAEKVFANTATTYGTNGKKALHLIFRGRTKRFRHVFQPLFLSPGAYRVSGTVRADDLKSKGGVKWVVSCSFPRPKPLGESEGFIGSVEWREFDFGFQIPEDCIAQEIRLVSGRARADADKITGGLWFDGMSIRRASQEVRGDGAREGSQKLLPAAQEFASVLARVRGQ